MDTEVYDEIRGLCIEMCRHSSRLRIVKGEDDKTTDSVPGADEFLKLDENRLSRDFKLYNFIGEISGKAYAIADFGLVLATIQAQLPEVLLPLMKNHRVGQVL